MARSSKQGFILITIMWIVIILMIIATSFTYRVRLNRQSTINLEKQMRLYHYARNGALIAMSKLKLDLNSIDHLGEAWAEDIEILYEISGKKVLVEVLDEGSKLGLNDLPLEALSFANADASESLQRVAELQSQGQIVSSLAELDPQYRTKGIEELFSPYTKINLNTVDVRTLENLLSQSGFDPGDARQFAAFVADLQSGSRDTDLDTDEQFKRPFFSLADLRSAFPEAQSLINQVLQKPASNPFLEMIGVSSSMNVNTAPEEALKAYLEFLDLSNAQSESIIALRDSKPIVSIQELTQDGLSDKDRDMLSAYLGVTSSYFRIRVEVYNEDAEHPECKLEAVVLKRLQDGDTQVQIVHWSLDYGL